MFPQLLHYGSFFLPTYGVLVATGVLVGLMMTAHIAHKQGLDAEKVWNLGILVVLGAIVGAKVLLIINDWSFYMSHPGEIFSLSTLRAGGVFYGGVLTALAISLYYMRKHRMGWLQTTDCFAPGLALGHAIGRLGCFAAGCCWGKPTSHWWGVTFHNPLAAAYVGTPLNIALEPTQLFESAVELANFLFLYWLIKRKKADGQVIGAYMALYGVARFFLEFIRDDPGRGSVFGGAMSGTQLISIFLVMIGGFMALRKPQEKRAAARAKA